MIQTNTILNLKARREIYYLIFKNPGLHLREISRRINISFGGLRYHIDFLLRKGLIVMKKKGRYNRYFALQNIGIQDQELLDILRQDIPCRLILLLLTLGPGEIYKNKKIKKEAFKNPVTYKRTYSKKELTELTKYWKGRNSHLFGLDRHPTTIEVHLKKLVDKGIIEKIKVGKEYKYGLKTEIDIWIFLIKYKKALSNKTIDLFLSWHPNELNEPVEEMTDKILTNIFDIFPHPYFG